MTNEQLAKLCDPERRQAGWWLQSVKHGDFNFTGPDWHASDDACFRDWRPVLLAAGYCIYSDSHGFTHVFRQGYQWFGDQTIGTGRNSYRAAILAAVEWLAEHEPGLLREAIARVAKGAKA